MSSRTDAIEARLIEIANSLQEGHSEPTPDFVVIHDALNLIRAKDEEIDLLRARSPRAYILARKTEWVRLFREVHGYLRTCHNKHGTDWSGRNHAMNALIEAMKFMEADDAARETTLEVLREAALKSASLPPAETEEPALPPQATSLEDSDVR